MKNREFFEAGGGWRLYNKKKSILIGHASFGSKLNDLQKIDLSMVVDGWNRYVMRENQLQSRTLKEKPPINGSRVMTSRDFPRVKGGRFFKSVTPEAFDNIRRGVFHFGSAEYYRNCENLVIQDDREGWSFFHLSNNNKELHIGMLSGFNSAIFCGTAVANDDRYASVSRRFGDMVLVIRDVHGFAKRACEAMGAMRYRIADVVYCDLKNFSADLPGVDTFPRLLDGSNLSKQALHRLNVRFFNEFYDASFLPSLFSKPLAYSEEKERRIVFEFCSDLDRERVIVEDKKLCNYLEFVQMSRWGD